MNFIKSLDEVNVIRDGGKILSEIFYELSKSIGVGSNLLEIDKKAYLLCIKYGVKPAFLGYKGYPNVICANLNDVIVHGIPYDINLKSGDILGLDMGIIYKDFYIDMSYTFGIGDLNEQTKDFVSKTLRSLYQGISVVREGSTVGDISYYMREGLVSNNFRLMRDFVGHGIGKNLHEPPEIPGEGLNRGEGMILKSGMVLAIESISVNSFNNSYHILDDGWTVKTVDGSLSALFEVTLIVNKNGYEIVTDFNFD